MEGAPKATWQVLPQRQGSFSRRETGRALSSGRPKGTEANPSGERTVSQGSDGEPAAWRRCTRKGNPGGRLGRAARSRAGRRARNRWRNVALSGAAGSLLPAPLEGRQPAPAATARLRCFRHRPRAGPRSRRAAGSQAERKEAAGQATREAVRPVGPPDPRPEGGAEDGGLLDRPDDSGGRGEPRGDGHGPGEGSGGAGPAGQDSRPTSRGASAEHDGGLRAGPPPRSLPPGWWSAGRDGPGGAASAACSAGPAGASRPLRCQPALRR